MVVAYDGQRGIGRGNELPWDIEALPSDLRHFRALTLGHAIIMGRRTYESIGRALPGRRNIVISRDETIARHVNIERAASFDEAMRLASSNEMIDIIGGGEVFHQALPLTERIYATEVDGNFGCEVSFPVLDVSEWHESAREQGSQAVDKYKFDFVTYERTAR
jgi:dihydrofolate reductase